MISLYELARAVGLQCGSQGIGFAVGVLVINQLSIDEFAVYSALSALTQTLVAASDLGATSTISYFYRLTNKSGGSFARYVVAVLRVRNILFPLAALILTPFFFLSVKNSTYAVADLGLVALALAIAWVSSTSSTLTNVLRISGALEKALWIDIFANISRLGMVVALVWLASASAMAILVAVCFTTCVQAFLTARAAGLTAMMQSTGGLAHETHEILRYMYPVIPGSLYYALQSNLLIWLVAIFGNGQQIAEVGVLGRFSQLFGLLTFVVGNLMIPKLAAITNDSVFLHGYLKFLTILLILGGALVGVSLLAPEWILFVAGPKYSGLTGELVIVVLTATVTLVGGYAVLVARLRGWNRLEPACTATQIGGQALMIASLDFSQTRGALMFGLLSSLLYSLPYLAVNAAGFMRPQSVTSLVPPNNKLVAG